MLGPDSQLLMVLLICASIALLVGLVRFRLLPIRLLCGGLSVVMAMTGGVAVVNYYYGYYTSWSQMWSDLHGSAGNLGVISGTTTSTASVESGTLRWIDLPGKLSGYDRQGLIYLPPQYGKPQYSRIRFPVVEMFHGTPGRPLTWSTEMRIDQIMNTLIAKHLVGPMILVMPAINGPGTNYQDCVNSSHVLDETYLLKDVRSDILAHYRATADSFEWGASGYSAGGYCAANLALRHRDSFGAAAIINGYYRAVDGLSGNPLQGNVALENANSPLFTAEKLSPYTSPLPAFWVAAGSNDGSDYPAAVQFTTALNRIEQVPFSKMNAGDTANAWKAALPSALIWLWQQLSTPDLKAQFPVESTASPLNSTLPVPPVKQNPAPTPCKLPASCSKMQMANAKATGIPL